MASEEPLFDPSLKKRKKKKAVTFGEEQGPDADPTQPAPETIENTTASGTKVDLGPSTAHELMKSQVENGASKAAASTEDDDFKAMFAEKKKKKKKITMDLGEESAPPPAGESSAPAGDDADFTDLKKKKKKKAQFDMEAFEKELNDKSKSKGVKEEEEDAEDDVPTGDHLELDGADLGDDPFAHETPVGVEAGTEAWLGSNRDYTYQELLTRFYSSLHAANPSLLSTSSGRRYTIAPPSIHREGNKKSIFANVTDICKRMHRPPEHVIQFLFAEMGTTGSVDGAQRLVIKGRFQQIQVENVLRRYIVEYVTCKTCKSPETLLAKENRIFFMTCESCGSRRSVNPIKSGFQAQVGKRSKNKTG